MQAGTLAQAAPGDAARSLMRQTSGHQIVALGNNSRSSSPALRAASGIPAQRPDSSSPAPSPGETAGGTSEARAASHSPEIQAKSSYAGQASGMTAAGEHIVNLVLKRSTHLQPTLFWDCARNMMWPFAKCICVFAVIYHAYQEQHMCAACNALTDCSPQT